MSAFDHQLSSVYALFEFTICLLVAVRVKHAAGRKTPRKTMVLTASKGRKSLEEIASLLQKAEVKPHLNIKKFDEAGVKEGFEMLKGRRTRGKIVFNIN